MAGTVGAGQQAAPFWRARAGELAEWAWRLLVNRTDAWGGYWPPHLHKRLGKLRTAPRVAERGKVFLTPETLAKHFLGECSDHIIGLHSTSPANTCRWGAFDVDRHDDSVDPAVTTRTAADLYVIVSELNSSM
jgi:hypothetical protein